MDLPRRAGGLRIGLSLIGILVASTLFFSASARAGDIVNRTGVVKAGPVRVEHVKSETLATPASGFWTPERLAAARPLDPPAPSRAFDIPGAAWTGATASAATGDFTPADPTRYPERVHGKIFFSVGTGLFSCSGTLIDSRGRNVVFTAGHCVYDHESGSFVSNLVFLPGYRNGDYLDLFYGTQVFTPPQWVNQEANAYDIATVTLDRPAAREFGSRKVAFDLNPRKREFTLFGYPSKPNPPFDGEVLRGCRSRFKGFDGQPVGPFPIGVAPCAMQQGSSGGGWVTLGRYVNSVVSYGYCDSVPELCGIIFGPVFSNAAKSLYSSAGGSVAPTVKLIKAPPRMVRKRKVNFRFGGTASTLLSFKCRLDRQAPVSCSSRISISRLRPGRHTLRVRAVDQTGRQSKRQIVRSFRVKLNRR